ncbi:3'-5' exonuclease [Thermobrachium celere]|uniref:3'-5' exonuclease n=1 Tax=Thermobrachium celere TaxID=53422 RepID=UPI0019453571|nr:exonuclease domain-containing protein [Thermobrachium celere]GFR34300.1 hypothetical protein TCEA9_01120 [Thermobrachium celere]
MSIKKIQYTNTIYRTFVALDFETTGLKPDKDKIIEIAAIKFIDNNIVDKFHSLVNPQIEIPKFITSINGITNEMVKNKPTIDLLIPKLLNFIGNLPIVAHNAGFDGKFLKYAVYNLYGKDIITNLFIDTVKIAKQIYPYLPNHKLETIKNYYKLNLISHRALDDTIVAANIYIDYCNMMKNNSCIK